MKSIIQDMKHNYFVNAVIMVLLGLVLVIWPHILGVLLCYLLGGALYPTAYRTLNYSGSGGNYRADSWSDGHPVYTGYQEGWKYEMVDCIDCCNSYAGCGIAAGV